MAEDAIQRAVIQRFEKGSRPVGFIAVKGELTPEQMKARREQLKYYVVARNYGANEFSQLVVNDAGAGEQGRPAASTSSTCAPASWPTRYGRA